ncbi:MAG: hypothetical protein NZL89_00085 [Leptospiraceae bacterium]|nr:hypothetical protein [Leptospiraceae bacterium]
MSYIVSLATEQEVFRNNLFIGELFFSGTMLRDKNGYAYSSVVRMQNSELYKTRILQALEETVVESLPSIIWTELAVLPVAVHSTVVREKHPHDGTDNINIPRLTYTIHWDGRRAQDSQSEGYYLLPVAEYYYGHTGGWFYGQEFGCGAGGRLALQAYVFDGRTGQTVFRFRTEKKALAEYDFRSNSHKMSATLAGLEKAALGELAKELKKL